MHPDLVFEYTPIQEDGTRELAISADGLIKLFPIVENLVENAPNYENWKIVAFRQRIPGYEMQINNEGIILSYSDIFFRYQDADYGELGIELFIKGYDGSGLMQNTVYILLDNLLGEYDTVMGIKWIEWMELKENENKKLLPLTNLRNLIDQKKEI